MDVSIYAIVNLVEGKKNFKRCVYGEVDQILTKDKRDGLINCQIRDFGGKSQWVIAKR